MSWFTDTLAKRLLILMWVALVGSHLVAFAVVSGWPFASGPPGRSGPDPLPTFPSLPPTPGLPDAGDERAPHGGPPPGPPPENDEGRPPGSPPGPGLPLDALLLDYGVRFGVIAAAAWFGSRWLSAPMRRLVEASNSLGPSLSASTALPVIDEHSGTREVREAARVFNTMARQLSEQFRSRGLMVAAISHDLRTPLTRLRLRLESADVDPRLRQRSVADIREMNELIDSVMEVFRLEGAGTSEPLQQTDLAALVQSIVDDLSEQGAAVGFSGQPVVTLAQPAALRRVVENLVANALRYGQSADVHLIIGKGRVRIVVDDEGPGIPAAEIDAVFRPFYRMEASRSRHTGGTGLGLHIARNLMAQQGGEVSIANRAEGGLRAEAILPLR